MFRYFNIKLSPFKNEIHHRISLLLYFIFLSLVLNWVYRFEILGTIKSIYPQYSDISLLTVFRHYFLEDFSFIFVLALLLALFSAIFYKSKVILKSIFFLLILFQSAIYALSLGYFQIFETSFSLNIFGAGLSTFWREILSSAIYEVPNRVYYFFLGSMVAALFSLFIFYFFAERSNEDPDKKNIYPRLTLFFILIFIFFLNRFDFINAEGFQAGKLDKSALYPKLKSYIADGNEFRKFLDNPLGNVIRLFPREEEITHSNKNISIQEDNNIDEKFQLGLDTGSIVSKEFIYRNKLPRGKKWNVIFYFFESTSNSYIGLKYKGRSVTPVWDKIKQNSFIANKHYAHYPLSVNAFVSVLSSMYDLPSKSWITQKYPGIKVKSVTELLKEDGYRTAVYHTANLKNFYHLDYLKHRQIDELVDFKTLKKSGYKNLTSWCADDRSMITPSIRFIKKDPGKPFFVLYFPIMPHHPYTVPEEKFQITREEQGLGKTTRKRRRFLRYLNSLYYSDFVLGELIDKLKKEMVLDNTILFIFGDHGEAFYQHRKNTLHALFIYEENVHVPFVIFNKKLFPKSVEYNGISRHIDIAPTLLDILNVEKPREYEGISLLRSHKKQFAILHTNWTDDYLGIRDDKWKYIIRTRDNREELYDLSQDQFERINLVSYFPELAKKFKTLLYNSRKYKKRYFKEITK